jgi:hypothetical protein
MRKKNSVNWRRTEKEMNKSINRNLGMPINIDKDNNAKIFNRNTRNN